MNASILTTTYVDFVPNNASVNTAFIARVLPYIASTSGGATLYAQYPPIDAIVGDVIITPVI